MSDINEQLNNHYNDLLDKIGDKNGISTKEIKLAVVVTFVQSYMQLVFKAISVSINSKDQSGAMLVLGMAEKISDGVGKIDKDATIDTRTEELISILENVSTPAYDILKIADISVPLIETVKSDFAIMSQFLKD